MPVKKSTKPMMKASGIKGQPPYETSPRLEKLFAQSMKLQTEIMKEIRIIHAPKKATHA